MLPDQPLLDVAIIGGGLAGLIHLTYARHAGLSGLVLERSHAVGGLWRDLPAWQDIQISTADWTVGDMPISGTGQPQVLANIASWVDRFQLSDGIRLNCPVSLARHTGTVWEVHTAQGVVRARHLVAATGAHNQPIIPPVERHNAAVREFHSSALRDPTVLRGQRVLVVGGGASAFDLLELCLEHGAQHTVWAHRGLRWFIPTGKPKAVAGSVRPFTKMQASGASIDQQNTVIGADMRERYAKFGIESILPDRPLDVRHDQLFPGRARMLANFAAFERHHASVTAIEGHTVSLSDKSRMEVDVLLWATGYATDLTYFENPKLADIRNTAQLAARCACVFRSLDEPNLYLPGVSLDGVGATSWLYALCARTTMSHIKGTARLDMEPMPHRINHLDMIRYLAQRDPGSFGADHGFDAVLATVLATPDDQPYPMP